MLHRQIRTPALHRILVIVAVALGALVLVALLAADSASAATYRVTKVGDPPPVSCQPKNCSLREAVRAANATAANDRIVLGPRTYRLSRAGEDDDALAGDLDVAAGSGRLLVVGRGRGRTRIVQNATDRIFEIQAGADLALRRLTVASGEASHGGAIRNAGRTVMRRAGVRSSTATFGGGIFSTGEARTTLRRTLIAGNEGSFGGGIFDNNDSVVTIVDSALRGNRAVGTGGGAIFNQNDSRLVVRRSTIDRNRATGQFSDGAGIYNQNRARATIIQSTISRNLGLGEMSDGGGIMARNQSFLRLINSTVSRNRARNGGGAQVEQQGRAWFEFSTIARNRARVDGGAIFENGSPPGPPGPPYVRFRGSIVAANLAPMTNNCAVSDATHVLSQGVNLESQNSCQFTRANDRRGTNPRLRLKLARNGGPTETHALKQKSPALNSVARKGCPKRDQRGVKRPQGRRCDRGAYELRR